MQFISRPVSAAHPPLLFLLLARVIGFLFKVHGERFAVGYERWPVKISLRDHRQVGVDGISNGFTRIPELAERQSKGRGDIIEKISYAFHSGFDVAQSRLAVALTGQREAEVEPRQVVALMLGKRFLQCLARRRQLAVKILLSSEEAQSSFAQLRAPYVAGVRFRGGCKIVQRGLIIAPKHRLSALVDVGACLKTRAAGREKTASNSKAAE